MVVTWNKADPRIWYGRCSPDGSTVTLNLVVELLPDGSGWDWAVWDPVGPKVSEQGVKRTAKEAVLAAEIVALLWHQIRKDDEMS
jgi:hypothetical protein